VFRLRSLSILLVLALPLSAAWAAPLPRIAVIGEAKVDGKPADGAPLLDAVNQVLLEAGFPLVAQDRLKAVRETIDLEGALNGKIPSELSALDVDLIVVARGTADELHGALQQGHATRFFGSKVTATVIRADTAQIAAAKSAHGHAGDLSPTSAAQRSLEKAVEKLGPGLVTALQSLATSERSVELAVYGMPDRKGIRTLQDAWSSLGLPALSERYFGLGLARFELTTREAGQALANKIDAERLPLEVIATSQTRIAARFAAAHGARVDTLFTPPQSSRGAEAMSDTVGELVYLGLSELGFLKLERAGLEGKAASLLRGGRRPLAAKALLAGTPARAAVFTQLSDERGALRLNVSVVGREGQTLAFASVRGDRNDPASLTSQALKALGPSLIAKAGAPELGTAPRLRILSGVVQEIFPAQVTRYAQTQAAELKVRAEGSLAFSDVRIQALLPGLMRLPTEIEVGALQPGEEKTIPLPLALDPAALAAIESSRASGLQVRTQYRVDGMEGGETRVLPVVIHDRHAIDWREPGSAAAFVTSEDSAVRAFATRALEAASTARLPRRLAVAAAIHQALTTLPLRYVKDPELAWGSSPLDSVELPRETLSGKSGDCDDLSVLYAALLESVGVRTALVLLPSHILIAFDTGVPESRRSSVSVDASRTVARNGTLWVPVETTAVDQSFERAWALAARELAEGKAEWVGVRESWAAHPKTSLAVSAAAPDLDVSKVTAADVSLAGELARARASELSRWVTRLSREARKHPSDPAIKAELVAALSLSGKAGDAVATAGSSADPRVKLNLGNALMSLGRGKDALEAYQDVRGPLAARARFNEGVAHQTLGESDAALSAFRAAAAGGLGREIATLLGVESERTRAAEAPGKQMDADIQALLAMALQKAPGAAPAKPAPRKPQEILPNAGRRGDQVSQALERQELLYWAL
jgi:hypothetical protein